MDATRAEVERESEQMLDRLRGARNRIEDQRKSIATKIRAGAFSADDFAGALHCLKQDEEEKRQYLYCLKILDRILERTQPPAVEGTS